MAIGEQPVDSADDKLTEAELQRMLDEALEMTFPASDPVALGAARRPPKEAADRSRGAAKPKPKPRAAGS